MQVAKRSKCLRQYCLFFREGLLCGGCDCDECLNDGQHEAEREAAIALVKTSEPLALSFTDEIRPDHQVLVCGIKDAKKRHVRGCRYDDVHSNVRHDDRAVVP